MMKDLILSNGKIELVGYPEGTKILGLNHPPDFDPSIEGLGRSSRELSRLREFQSDLLRVGDWSQAACAEDTPMSIREACAIAGVVKFAGCFDSTKGLRQKPLAAKAIFEAADRQLVERIRRLRNRMAAHDDQGATGNFGLLAVAPDATAIEALAFRISTPVVGMPEVTQLHRLTSVAMAWVETEADMLNQKIVAEFNTLPIPTRLFLLASFPEFKLTINEADLLA